MEVTSHRKRRREAEGATAGVKRKKEDEQQHHSTRSKAVGTFVAAAEGVCLQTNMVHVEVQPKCEVQSTYPPPPHTHTHTLQWI